MRRARFVLASGSPRRAAILEALGVRFTVVPAGVDEAGRDGESPAAYVRRLARRKARTVPGASAVIVIGADTVVALGRCILGKPESTPDAERMLRMLSGRTHDVLTGVALFDSRCGRIVSGVERSAVSFRRLDAAEIRAYVRSGEPLDKAGAYAIQGGASVFVDRIEGNYLNIVGFPVSLFLRLCRRLGLKLHQPGVNFG